MEALAVEADVNDKYLGSIERGQQAASIDIIEKIADGLGVEVYELFVYRGIPERILRAKAKELLGEATDEQLQRVVAVLEAMLH